MDELEITWCTCGHDDSDHVLAGTCSHRHCDCECYRRSRRLKRPKERYPHNRWFAKPWDEGDEHTSGFHRAAIGCELDIF